MYEYSPVTAGPLVEEGLNPVHHLLAVLGGGDVQVHVPVPHVTITNHASSTLALQSFLVHQGYTQPIILIVIILVRTPFRWK